MQALREEDYVFNESGLYCKGNYVANFRLKVLEKVSIKTFDGRSIRKEYVIQAELPDGTTTDKVVVQNYKKTEWFEYWDCCNDVTISPKQKKMLLDNLLHQMQKLPWREKIILEHSGLYQGNQTVYVFGRDMIVGEQSDIRTYVTDNNVPAYKLASVELSEMTDYVLRWCNFYPGVTDILFLYLGLAILKPVFVTNNIKIDTLLALIGVSGTLKTTLAEICAYPGSFIKFLTVKPKELESILNNYQGKWVIFDDYKEAKQRHVRERMMDIFEILARTADYSHTAMAITTCEFIEGDFSFQDRLIQVYVDKRKREYTQEELSELTFLQQNKKTFDYFWYDFACKVYSDLDKITEIIRKNSMLVQENKSGYRIGRNTGILTIVYMIFQEYYFNKNQRSMQNLNCSINRILEKQKEHMSYMEFLKNEPDWAEIFYQAYDRGYFPVDLEHADAQVVFSANKLYITPLALECGVSKMLHCNCKSELIAKDLDKKQLLMRDASRDRTLKRHGIRYYVVDWNALKLYRKCYGSQVNHQSDMIIQVIRK